MMTILYIDTIPGERIQETSLAGMRRYAAVRGWDVVAVPVEKSRPADVPALLEAHRPLAGCIVECADGRRDLPPRLFGKVPVVYLHAAPSLYGGWGMRVNADNEAIAAAAFRELSAGRPSAFAVIAFAGYVGKREWSLTREKTFASLALKTGKPFFHLPWKRESRKDRAARIAKWVSALPRHTAIFAVNDITASEVVDAACAASRQIPRELILLGVDNNIAICEASRPAVSSVQVDHERTGYVAARMIGNLSVALRRKGLAGSARIADAGTPAGRVRDASVSASAPHGPTSVSIGPLLAVRRASTCGPGRREPFILEAVETIRREACNGLTAEELASRFPCSRWLFEMRFREAMGHSVLEEITSVRIEQACTYLSTTEAPIAAIADFCGFGSYRSLHAVFRERTGLTPSGFRLQSRT